MRPLRALVPCMVAAATLVVAPASGAEAAAPPRGAAPIGSAAYPAPAGAIYVSPTGNNASSGTIGSPLRTIAAGLAKAPAGGTVVLRGGTYHEGVTSSRPVTIQNHPGEAVWLDGSVAVTGWAKSGTRWVKSGWTVEFDNSMGSATLKGRMVGPNPMAADPDQVFLNGAQQRQVGSVAEVTAGTFFVDDSANTITLGSDPTGKEVRASDIAQAINLTGGSSTIQGIGIRRYATGYEKLGTVRLSGVGGRVRHVMVYDSATVGISTSGTDKLLENVTVRRAGVLGVGMNVGDRSSVLNSIISDNNTEHFKPEPVSGGLKITSAKTIRVDNNEVSGNLWSRGIWFDVSCYDISATRNVVSSNGKHGLEVEISAKAIVADNLAVNNGEANLIAFDANDVQFWNNDVGYLYHQWHGIKIAQDGRRAATYREGWDPRVGGPDPRIPFLTDNIVMSNNVFGSGGLYQIYALDGKSNSPADLWNLTIDGNLFNPGRPTNRATMVAWGEDDNVTLQRYETPAALAAAKNPAWRNAQTTLQPLADMADDKAAYIDYARPLPGDVAAATGQPAGVRLLGTFPR